MRLDQIESEKCKALLNAMEAHILPRGEALVTSPVVNAQEVQVQWGPFSEMTEQAMCMEFLRYVTWPTNAANPMVVMRYVDGIDPETPSFEVDHQKFYGRWRQASIRGRKEEVRSNEFRYYIVLTLRRGWANSLDNDEWLGEKGDGNALVGQYEVTRYNPNVASDATDTLFATLATTATVTNPQMDGQTLSGTFAAKAFQRRNEDGSYTLGQTLTKLGDITKTVSADIATELYALTWTPRHDAQTLNLFGLNSTGNGENMAITWDHLTHSTAVHKALMSTMTGAALAAKFADYPDSTYGWTFADRRYDISDSGGWARFTVLLKKRTWNATAWSQAQNIGFDECGGRAKPKRLVLRGMTKAQAQTVMRTLTAETIQAWANSTAYYAGDYVTSGAVTYVCLLAHTSPATPTAFSAGTNWAVTTAEYILVSKTMRYEDESAEYVVEATEAVAYSGTGAADEVTHIKGGSVNANSAADPPAAVQLRWYRRTEAAKNTLISTNNSSTDGQAVTKYSLTWEGTAYTLQHMDVSASPNGDGTYDIVQTCGMPTGIDDTDERDYFGNSCDVAYYVYRREDRNSDNYFYLVRYAKFISTHRSRKAAYKWLAKFNDNISTTSMPNTAPDNIKAGMDLEKIAPYSIKREYGSDQVDQMSKYIYKATVLIRMYHDTTPYNTWNATL